MKLDIDPVNLLIGAAWGAAALLSWTALTVRRYRRWRHLSGGLARLPTESARAWRDFVFVVPLELAAVLFALGLVVVIWRQPATASDRMAVSLIFGLLFGAFTAAGVLGALLEREDRR